MNDLYFEFDPRFFNNDLLFLMNNIKSTYFNENSILRLSDIHMGRCEANAELHFIKIRINKEDLKEEYQKDFINDNPVVFGKPYVVFDPKEFEKQWKQ